MLIPAIEFDNSALLALPSQSSLRIMMRGIVIDSILCESWVLAVEGFANE